MNTVPRSQLASAQALASMRLARQLPSAVSAAPASRALCHHNAPASAEYSAMPNASNAAAVRANSGDMPPKSCMLT